MRRTALKTKAERMVGYCGLYCGDCPGHTQKIPDLAEELSAELRRVKLERVIPLMQREVPGLKHYAKGLELLGGLAKLRCPAICRDRDEKTGCVVSRCCRERKYLGCWECAEFESCSKMKGFLDVAHGDAHIRNLRRIARYGVRKFIGGKREW
jgi:hypothetical protein